VCRFRLHYFLQTGSVKVAFYTKHEDAGLPVVARLDAPYEAIKRFRDERGRCGHLRPCNGRKGGTDIERGLGCAEACADVTSQIKASPRKRRRRDERWRLGDL
jgi:hypothetical protein